MLTAAYWLGTIHVESNTCNMDKAADETEAADVDTERNAN